MTFAQVLLIAALLAFIPAYIASQKGRSGLSWWFFGFVLFIVALPCAILVKPTDEHAEKQAGHDRHPCPACKELIRNGAVKCRFCGERFDVATSRAS